MNIAPSLEPAAIRLVSRLNDTRDQSQPTLKLSLLNVRKYFEQKRKTHLEMEFIIIANDNMCLTHQNVLIIWFMRRSNNLMVSSRTQLSKYLQSFDKSNDVILPWRTISLAEQSVRVSQNRIFLS